MAKEIYGKLISEETYVPLDIAANAKEVAEIHREYRDVFGENIEFFERKMTNEEYSAAKVKALVNLVKILKN